jgi:hypothetical protein
MDQHMDQRSLDLPNITPSHSDPVLDHSDVLTERDSVQSVQVEGFLVDPDAADKPPRWLVRRANWFRMGFAIFMLLYLLMGLLTGCASGTAIASWRSATDILPPNQLQDILQQHAEGLDIQTAIARMQAWQVKASTRNIVLIDYNTKGLCGQIGCLYNGYLLREEQAPEEILSNYYTPDLPEGKSLFQVSDEAQFDLPCLEVNQTTEREGEDLQIHLCYNGLSYQISDMRHSISVSKP